MINNVTLLEADLRFIHRNLCYAKTQCREVFRKYGEVSIEADTYAGRSSLCVRLDGRVVYSHEGAYLEDVIGHGFPTNHEDVVKWHYDSPKIRQAVAAAARKCSSAIHQNIEAQKARAKAYRKKVREEKRSFEKKWGVG